jgi:hypothetical protein
MATLVHLLEISDIIFISQVCIRAANRISEEKLQGSTYKKKTRGRIQRHLSWPSAINSEQANCQPNTYTFASCMIDTQFNLMHLIDGLPRTSSPSAGVSSAAH